MATKNQTPTTADAPTGCRNPRDDEHPGDCPGPDSNADALELCWPCHHYRRHGRLPIPFAQEAREQEPEGA